MPPSTFTVIICTHNRCAVLPRALEAMARFRPPAGGSFEVLVVDNASTDATPEVVRDFAARSPVPFRYLFEPRTGKSIALNAGVAAAASPFLAFTDDDACPAADWLERLAAAFDQFDAHWVYGRVDPLWDGPPPSWFGPEVRPYFAVMDHGPEPFLARETRHSFYGVNLACRRPAVVELGGFREDFGPQGNQGGVGEDCDVYHRAVAAGHRVLYAPDAAVRHIIPARRCTKSLHRRNMWTTSAAYFVFLLREPPPPPTILGLPRYFYRKLLDHGMLWAKQTLRRRPSAAFYHELQTLRFGMLIWHALQSRFRRGAAGALLARPTRETQVPA